jgi:hypothetical protein
MAAYGNAISVINQARSVIDKRLGLAGRHGLRVSNDSETINDNVRDAARGIEARPGIVIGQYWLLARVSLILRD